MCEHQLSIDAITIWDAHAFHLLYKHYYKALVNYAFQFVGDNDDAEDVVQGFIADIWQQKLAFGSLFSLEVFLYNSVRNRCLNILKHKQVKVSYIKKVADSHPAYHPDDDEETLFMERAYRMLFETIDKLPPRSREVFLLYIQGKKNQEIADALGVSLETVKTHKKRSMAFLREQLDGKTFALLLLMLSVR